MQHIYEKGLNCFGGRGVKYIHNNCHESWISQYQTRGTVEIFFTRLRLMKNISPVALVWYCEIHFHDSCVYTIVNRKDVSKPFTFYSNVRRLFEKIYYLLHFLLLEIYFQYGHISALMRLKTNVE